MTAWERSQELPQYLKKISQGVGWNASNRFNLPSTMLARIMHRFLSLASLVCEWRSMFDFNLMKITAEQIQSGRTLSEALDVAEARRIYLSEEWTPSILPTINR